MCWGSVFLSVRFSGNLTMFPINSIIIWLQDIFLYINCDSTEWMISLLAWSSLLSMPPRKMLCIKCWKNSFWSRRIYIQPFPLHTQTHVYFFLAYWTISLCTIAIVHIVPGEEVTCCWGTYICWECGLNVTNYTAFSSMTYYLVYHVNFQATEAAL